MGVRGPSEHRIDFGSTKPADFEKQMKALSAADTNTSKVAQSVMKKETEAPKSLADHKFSAGDKIISKLKSFAETIAKFFSSLKPSAKETYVLDIYDNIIEVPPPKLSSGDKIKTETGASPVDTSKTKFRQKIDELNQQKVRLLDNIPAAKKREMLDMIQEFDRDFKTQMIYARNEVTAWDGKATSNIDQSIKELEAALMSFEDKIK